jgi:hypothetical protein
MIYTVPKSWQGETCVILAGGPSLRDFSRFPSWITDSKCRVIAINDSWRLWPYSDVCYFCDPQWWQYQLAKNLRDKPTGTLSFHDAIYKEFWISTAPGFEHHPQVHTLKFNGQTGLSTDPTALHHGSNSGFACINLAALFGAKRIVLLGYDMKCDKTGRTHWHNEPRPDGFARVLEQSMLPLFSTLVTPLEEAGVEVINATPDSALTCWKYQPLEEALQLTSIKE